jgi:predicted NBD/HSP70 family sugar kinase
MASEISDFPAVRQTTFRSVLEILLRGGPVSRAHIARRTGLSKQTISDVMRDLEQNGWVEEHGLSQGSIGRSALNYCIRGRSAYALAVDLGGTKLHVALVDITGRIVSEATEPTDARGGIEVVKQIDRVTANLAREAGADRSAIRVGVMGSPGVVDPTTGGITIAPNIPGLDSMDVAAALKGELGFPFALENDVNLAAVGEGWRGENGDARTFAFIAIGTGIGLGLVADGRLIRGAHGAAGEIAYLPVGGDPFDARNFRLGTLEAAIHSAAISERYAGRGGPQKTVRDIFAASETGDEAARATLEEVARIVAMAVLSVSCLIDPELVVFGGSIGSRPELLAEIDRALARCMARPARTAISSLGARATLIGAIGIGLDRLHEGLFGIQPALGTAPTSASLSAVAA